MFVGVVGSVICIFWSLCVTKLSGTGGKWLLLESESFDIFVEFELLDCTKCVKKSGKKGYF